MLATCVLTVVGLTISSFAFHHPRRPPASRPHRSAPRGAACYSRQQSAVSRTRVSVDSLRWRREADVKRVILDEMSDSVPPLPGREHRARAGHPRNPDRAPHEPRIHSPSNRRRLTSPAITERAICDVTRTAVPVAKQSSCSNAARRALWTEGVAQTPSVGEINNRGSRSGVVPTAPCRFSGTSTPAQWIAWTIRQRTAADADLCDILDD
jgi:hypothetical protein